MPSSEAHLKAAKKWAKENNYTISVKFNRKTDPSKDQIRQAAEREGLSVNAFIIEAIRDKL